MKDTIKITAILLWGILLSIAPLLPANPTPQVMQIARKKANAGGGGGYNLEYEQTSNTTGQVFGDITNRTYEASVIAASELGSGFTLTRVELEFAVGAGTPAYTITCRVWSNNDNSTPADYTDDNPNTLLASSTTTVTGAQVVSGGQAWYAFDFAGLAISASTDYWVGMSTSAVDASNYCVWMRTSAGVQEEMRGDNDGSPAWGGLSSVRGGAVRLYSGSP